MMNVYILWLATTSICLTPIFACKPRIHDNELCCWGRHHLLGLKHPADCEAAIRMIPSGKLTLDIPATAAGDPQAAKLPYVSMEQDGGRTLRLPAAFIAGGCVVLVEATSPGNTPPERRPPPRPPQNAATHMYLRVWPKVKLAAKTVLRKCLRLPRGHDAGDVTTSSDMGGWEFLYKVTVKDAISKKGRGKALYPGYHIYESEELPWTYAGRGSRLRAEAEQRHSDFLDLITGTTHWPIIHRYLQRPAPKGKRILRPSKKVV